MNRFISKKDGFELSSKFVDLLLSKDVTTESVMDFQDSVLVDFLRKSFDVEKTILDEDCTASLPEIVSTNPLRFVWHINSDLAELEIEIDGNEATIRGALYTELLSYSIDERTILNNREDYIEFIGSIIDIVFESQCLVKRS